MPNTFKNVLASSASTLTTVYTCPAATTAIVIGCQASNRANTGTVALDLKVDSGAQSEFLLNDVAIPQNASLQCIAGKLVLEAGDLLRAQTGSANDVSLIVSVLEIS